MALQHTEKLTGTSLTQAPPLVDTPAELPLPSDLWLDRHRHGAAYRFAGFLAGRYETDTIIDLGGGSVPQLIALPVSRKVVVDSGAHLERRRGLFRDEHIVHGDLARASDIHLDPVLTRGAVVICAGVLETLGSPDAALALLARLAEDAAVLVVSAGPGRWTAEEFDRLLRTHDLTPAFTGFVTGSDDSPARDSLLAVVAPQLAGADWTPPDEFRPLAVVTTYNDVDIAEEVVETFLDDGMDVLVIDNWSTDGTYEELMRLAAGRSQLVLERFPADGPSRYFELQAMLRRKEAIVHEHAGRWIVHHDSDELRRTPWAGVSLRAGLYVADRSGFNAVDFTACDFRPVAGAESGTGRLEERLRHFEFRAPSRQIKVWRQPQGRVDLVTTGGHDVQFAGRRVFPFNFLLKHFPLRSPAQAARKVFTERLARYAPEERALAWHTHYDAHTPADRFEWQARDLIAFDAGTPARFLVELLSAAVQPAGGAAIPAGARDRGQDHHTTSAMVGADDRTARANLRRLLAAKDAAIDALWTELTRQDSDNRRLRDDLAATSADRGRMANQVMAARADLEARQRDDRAREVHDAAVRDQAARHDAEREKLLQTLHAEVAELRASTSWRVTAPLRWLGTILKRASR